MNEWTKEDALAAEQHGWNLYLAWDQDKLRVEYVIQRTRTSTFKTDENARKFVASCAIGKDKLADKAVRLVFTSKVGTPTKPKRKKA